MSDSFNLVFIKVEENQNPDTVRLKLAESLKTDESRVQAWIDAQGPVTLLRDVDQATAEKVRNVVLRCGAICEIEELVKTDESGLGLVPKKFGSSDRFVCPQCHAEKEIPTGSTVDVCEACGLVVAKWEQKKKADREKELERRRLLREAQLKESSEEQQKRQRAELERLQSEADALRKTLGIKGPGKLAAIVARYPRIVLGGSCLLVASLTLVALVGYQQYDQEQQHQALLAKEESVEILKIAPAVAAVVRLQRTGNRRLVTDMANVASVIRKGHSGDAAALESAAKLMMKGLGPQNFLQLLEEYADVVEHPGLIAGMDGVDFFAPGQLPVIAGTRTGTDLVLELVGERTITEATNPDQDFQVIDPVEHLDGSELVDLIDALSADPEWDDYLHKQAIELVYNEQFDMAEEIAIQISAPAIKARIFSEILLRLSQQNEEKEVRIYAARIELELGRIEESEQRIKQEIEFGTLMASLGYEDQPARAIARVTDFIQETDDTFQQSVLQAQLASALAGSGDPIAADDAFARAVSGAGNIESDAARMRAFTRIAQRYYDARYTTLANEILVEVGVAAASQLAPTDRALVFAELALAQAYVGDMRGANLSISNTGSGRAQTQVLTLLAEFLIQGGSSYKAIEVIDSIDDPMVRSQLLTRLSSELMRAGKQAIAEPVLGKLAKQLMVLPDTETHAILISKMARLYARLGFEDLAQSNFNRAIAMGFQGTRADLTSAAIAIDQIHSLMFAGAMKTNGLVVNPIISEPIESLIASVRLSQARWGGN